MSADKNNYRWVNVNQVQKHNKWKEKWICEEGHWNDDHQCKNKKNDATLVKVKWKTATKFLQPEVCWNINNHKEKQEKHHWKN